MYYKLFLNQQEELKSMPETGMSYQLIQARFAGEYSLKEFIVLNEELIIENNPLRKNYLKEIFSKGFKFSVRRAVYKDLKDIKLRSENESLNVLEERGDNASSAKNNAVIYPDGQLIMYAFLHGKMIK